MVLSSMKIMQLNL